MLAYMSATVCCLQCCFFLSECVCVCVCLSVCLCSLYVLSGALSLSPPPPHTHTYTHTHTHTYTHTHGNEFRGVFQLPVRGHHPETMSPTPTCSLTALAAPAQIMHEDSKIQRFKAIFRCCSRDWGRERERKMRGSQSKRQR